MLGVGGCWNRMSSPSAESSGGSLANPAKPPPPESLIYANGPQTKTSTNIECHLCQEPTSSTEPTLVHSSCGSWFHESYLRICLDGGGTNTCLMCRKKFGICAIDSATILAPPDEDELEAIARKRHARVRPTRYYIRRTFRGALALLGKELPELSPETVLNYIDHEISLYSSALQMGEDWTE
jgi:hypothetical protein